MKLRLRQCCSGWQCRREGGWCGALHLLTVQGSWTRNCWPYCEVYWQKITQNMCVHRTKVITCHRAVLILQLSRSGLRYSAPWEVLHPTARISQVCAGAHRALVLAASLVHAQHSNTAFQENLKVKNLLRGHLFSFLLRASWIAVKGMSVIIAVEQWSVINYSFSDCVLPASFSYHTVNLECKKDTSPAVSKEEGRICPPYFLPEVSFSLWRSVFECGIRSIFNNWFRAEPATSVLNSVLSLLFVCAEVFWDWISWGREQAWWNPEQETEIPKSFSLKLMAIFWLWYTLRPASSLLELGGEFPAEQAFWCISLTFSIDKRHL